LSDGVETTCYSITVAGYPASHDVGPFCPDTITDSADEGGLWFDGDGVYDLDGEFFVDLPTLYGDDNWQMREPSWLTRTAGCPPSMTATTEFVVPRSMPMTFLLGIDAMEVV
jgi:hypothetical protein